MGPTPTRIPTPTLGMRLSCNFVNVYTRASLTDILARILARKITPRVGQVGEDPRACPARGRSSRGSRRGCPCRCRCPCRSHGIPAIAYWSSRLLIWAGGHPTDSTSVHGTCTAYADLFGFSRSFNPRWLNTATVKAISSHADPDLVIYANLFVFSSSYCTMLIPVVGWNWSQISRELSKSLSCLLFIYYEFVHRVHI